MNTLKQKAFFPAVRMKSVGWLFLTALLWLVTTQAYGQTTPEPGWGTGFPKFALKDGSSSLTKGIANDDDVLEVKFTPTGGDVVKPTLEINLTGAVAYNSRCKKVTGTNESTVAIGTPVQKGTILTIPFEGALVADKTVHLKISVKATNAAVAGDDTDYMVSAQLKSDGKEVGSKSKEVQIYAKEPALLGAFSVPANLVQDQETAIQYKIQSTGGETSDFTLTFTANEVVTFSDFKIEGNDIKDSNLDITSPDASGDVVYTLKLTEALMGGRLDANSKTIDMNITLSRSGILPVTHKATTNYGESTTFVPYSFNIIGSGEKPNMVHIKTGHLKSNPNNASSENFHDNSWHAFRPSMTGVSWVKSSFKNESGTNAYDIVAEFSRYGNFTCLDMEGAYYIIKGDGKTTKGDFCNLKPGKKISESNPQTYVGVIKPEYQNKYTSFTGEIQKKDFVPADGTIEFYIPTYVGNIYDDTVTDDLFLNNAEMHYGSMNVLIKKVTNSNGDPGLFDVVNIRFSRLDVPHFREMPTAINFGAAPNNTNTARLRFSTGNIPAAAASAVVNVTMPTWLTITAARVVDLAGDVIPDVTVALASPKVTLNSPNFVRDCYLEFEYESTATDPKEETINYSMDFLSKIGTGGEMKNVYRVSQPVSVSTGASVSLTSFELQRETRGFKTVGSSELADYKDIRNDIYMPGDKGRFIWKVSIEEDGFKHLNLSLDASNQSLEANVTPTGKTSVKIIRGGVEITPAPTAGWVNGSLCCDFDFENGDEVILTAEFDTVESFDRKYYFTSKCTASNETDTKGNDIRYAECGIYSLDLCHYWNAGDQNQSFTGNGEKEITIYGYIISFRNEILSAPYFENEIRNLSWLKQLTLTAPEGYTVNRIIVQKSGIWDANNTANQKEVTPSPTSSGNKYIFDLESLYNDWGKPDARWNQSFAVIMTANKSAGKGMLRSALTVQPATGKEFNLGVSWGTPNLEYTGPSVKSILPNEVYASSKEISIKGIQIINPTKDNLSDAWLYVEGNVTGLISDTYTGSGNWVKVSGVINSEETVLRDLKFTYNGQDGGKVKIYVLSGYGSDLPTPSGSISGYMESVGDVKEITVRVAEVQPMGEISLSSTELKSTDEYDVTIKMNSNSSTASVVNPQMVITVPKDQQFVSAILDYGTSSSSISSDDLKARLTIPDKGGDFTFDLAKALGTSVTLPGTWDTESATLREATLTIKYKPGCDTPTGGIRYVGTLKATSPFGDKVTDRTVRSSNMFPEDKLAYKFTVDVTAKDDKYAFNEVTKDGILYVKLKLSRIGTVKTEDFLKLTLPTHLTVNTADVAWISQKDFNIGEKPSEVKKEGTYYKLSLPANAFNDDQDDVITYTIPVTYTTPTAEALAALAATPVETVEAMVSSMGESFCPGGASSPAQAGIGTRDLAFVVTDKAFPLTAFIGAASTVKVTSYKFEGSMSGWTVTDKVNFSFTPSAPDYTDATADIENGAKREAEINVIIDGKNYGKVNASFNVYPSLDFKLKGTDFTESDGSPSDIPLSSYLDTSSPVSTYTKVVFYKEEECTNSVENVMLDGDYDYWVRAENNGGKSAAKKITVKVEKATRIDEGGLGDISVPVGKPITLSINGATGVDPISFQWQKKAGNDFVNITSATDVKFEIAEAKLTDSGIYRVVATGSGSVLLGKVAYSKEVKVNVYTPSSGTYYQVTYEASVGGKVEVTYMDWPVYSGEYVDAGTRLFVEAKPVAAGLRLKSITVNNKELSNSSYISIMGNTHIVAQFEVDDADPSTDPTGNTKLDEELKVWSFAGQLFVETTCLKELTIYSISGRLMARRSVNGIESFALPVGVYLVYTDSKIYKIMVNN